MHPWPFCPDLRYILSAEVYVTLRTVVRWTMVAGRPVRRPTFCPKLPTQTEARARAPGTIIMASHPLPGKTRRRCNTVVRPHRPRPSINHGFIFPLTFVTLTIDSLPVPATARSPELGVSHPVIKNRTPALPELPTSSTPRSSTSPRGHRFRRH